MAQRRTAAGPTVDKATKDDDDDDVLDQSIAEANKAWSLQKWWVFILGPLICLSMTMALMSRGKIVKKSFPVGVQVLTEANFDSFLHTYSEGVLVDFYTPGCIHCEKLVPEFDKAAKALRASNVPFAKVNAEAEPKLAKRAGTKRYPTVLWYRKGENVQELPPMSRSSEKIVEFVEWANQESLVEFDTRAAFDEALPQLRMALNKAAPFAIVGFASETNEVYEALERAAERLRGKTVFLIVKEHREGDPVLRGYTREEELDVEYRGQMGYSYVQRWTEMLLKITKDESKAKAAKDEIKVDL